MPESGERLAGGRRRLRPRTFRCWSLALACGLVLLNPGAAGAQAPKLLFNSPPDAIPGAPWRTFQLTRTGTRLAFADELRDGLYSYEPETGQTHLLVDLSEGQSFQSFNLLGGGDEDIFASFGSLESRPLAGTDATPAGTRMVLESDLPGVSLGHGVGPDEKTPIRNDHIFLLAFHPGGSRAIWATDATAAGTFQVSIPTAASTSSFCDPTVLGDEALFPVAAGAGATELWLSDGTPSGTSLSGVVPYAFHCTDSAFTLQSRAVYTCSTSPGVRALCLTDGTASGTEVVAVAAYPSFSGDLERVYFRGWNGRAWNLWRSDGSARGTYELQAATKLDPPLDLTNNSASVPRGLVFNLFLSNAPSELWFAGADGTVAERLAVTCDSSAGCTGLPTRRIWRVGDVALFFAFDSQRGAWLWATDGTAPGTVPVLEVNGITVTSHYPQFEAFEDGRWYFLGSSAELGEELYVSDGTAGGSRRLTEFANAGAITGGGFGNLELAILGDRAWFAAAETDAGHQLYSVSPHSAGAVQETHWSHAWSGVLGSVGGRPALFGFERLCYAGTQAGLWASDGTPANTFRILLPSSSDCAGFPIPTTGAPYSWGSGLAVPWRGQSGLHQLFWLGSIAQDVQEVTQFDDRDVGNGMQVGSAAVYQAQRPDSSWELWASDTPLTAPRFIGALPAETWFTSRFQPLRGLGLFAAAAEDNECDVFRTDATAAGTYSLGFGTGAFVCPNISSFHVTRVGNRGFFLMRELSTGGAIWETGGDLEDTAPFTPPTLDVLSLLEPSLMQGQIVFAAGEHGRPRGLYSQLLDTESARRLTDLAPLPPPEATGLGTYAAATSSHVFMTGYDSDHGQELWVSDGNGASFTLLRDIAPGSRSSLPQYLTVVDDLLLFSANDDSHGRELWISDGTEAGTRMIWEPAQGGFSSAPSNLSVIGQDLLFTAYHPRIGREQWILHLGTGTDGLIFDDDFESGTTAQWEEPPY
jgi:ELWxxDGT repeat protein